MGRKGRRYADNDDDDDFIDPIAAALAKADADDQVAASVKTAKKLSKTELRKQKKKGKVGGQDTCDNEKDDDAATGRAMVNGNDDKDKDDPSEFAQSPREASAESVQRNQQTKDRGMDDAYDDDMTNTVTQAHGNDGNHEYESSAPGEQPKLLSKAEQRKQKRRGKVKAFDDDNDEELEAYSATEHTAEESNDDKDEPFAPALSVKKLSKAEQRKQKKKAKREALETDGEKSKNPICKSFTANTAEESEEEEDEQPSAMEYTAEGDNDDREELVASAHLAKKLSKAEQRKHKKNAKRDASERDYMTLENPTGREIAPNNFEKNGTESLPEYSMEHIEESDIDDHRQPAAEAHPVKKLSKAEQRKQKKKAKREALEEGNGEFETRPGQELHPYNLVDDDTADVTALDQRTTKLTKAEQRKKKYGKAREHDEDDDDLIESTATANAADDDEDSVEDYPAPPHKGRHATKASQRKQRMKKGNRNERENKNDINSGNAFATAIAPGDDEDDDELHAPSQPVLAQAGQHKLNTKEGRRHEDNDEDAIMDPLAQEAWSGHDDDDNNEPHLLTIAKQAQKVAKAERRKQKQETCSGALVDDNEHSDKFADERLNEEQGDGESPATSLQVADNSSQTGQGEQKYINQGPAGDCADSVEAQDLSAEVAVVHDEEDGRESPGHQVEDSKQQYTSRILQDGQQGTMGVDEDIGQLQSPGADNAQSTNEPKKKLSKAERKKLKKGGGSKEPTHALETGLASSPLPARGESHSPIEGDIQQAHTDQVDETTVSAPTKASIFNKKRKDRDATSAFSAALAKKYEEKKEDEDDEAEGGDIDMAEKLAKYEKKLAKAEKKGEPAEIERYRSKVEKYTAKIASASTAKAVIEDDDDVDDDKAAAAAGGLFSGKDGEAWRDDSNDLSKDTIPETFEEALLAAIAANDGKPLGSKAKKKLEKEWNAKRRQAAEIADREKRSLEGAQFAVSQSAIDEEDANWVNSLDIKIDSFSISAAGKTLFENSPLSIVHGRRYGIVGPNGRGKTTLLKMIASNELKAPPRIHCLYVEQEVMADNTRAVDAVLRADKERNALLEEEMVLTAALETGKLSSNEQRNTSERLAEIGQQLLAIGAHAAEAKARRILFGLGFSAEMQMRPTNLFSGGWRMRISLARALFIEPTLLMLDVIWLDDYLQKYKHTLMIVSHDQDFLNSVCMEILHISEERKLDAYKGNYDTFKTLEKQKRAQQLKEWEKQQKQLRALKSKGGASKAKAEELVKKQAQNKREPGARSKKQAVASGQDSAEVTQLIERPREYLVKMEFPDCAQLSPPVLQVCDATFRYSPELPYIFTEMNFGIDQETRVCVVGNNGSGKSTLLNLLTGKLTPTGGEIKHNPRLRIGVYNQHFVERLPMDESPVDYLRRLFQEETYQSIRNMLGRYGLSGHAHTIAMRDLSGGQKARVVLCELSLAKPHILLLDEPTNNLDIETIDALCDAINDYNGGVVCVTHDARLIEATRMRLWVVQNRQVTEWSEPFEAYREHLLETLEKAMAQEDQRITAAGLSVDMGGNRS